MLWILVDLCSRIKWNKITGKKKKHSLDIACTIHHFWILQFYQSKHFLFLTGFLVYSGVVLVVVSVLIFRFAPLYGEKNMIVYVGICSLMGSITVGSLSLKVVLTVEVLFLLINPWYLSAGYECQSLGNCLKADIFRIEPIHLLSDMAFHYSCGFCLPFADQLLEQGKFQKLWSLNPCASSSSVVQYNFMLLKWIILTTLRFEERNPSIWIETTKYIRIIESPSCVIFRSLNLQCFAGTGHL
jgi:hypothetical protein